MSLLARFQQSPPVSITDAEREYEGIYHTELLPAWDRLDAAEAAGDRDAYAAIRREMQPILDRYHAAGAAYRAALKAQEGEAP